MSKIIILDEQTANKIAAGEVVERPASVVKELIENSIDACAKRIHVSIKKGGISQICITDDGIGIDENDIQTAFERHATSKLISEEGLSSISTLGFRGEALASIASVSKIKMQTRPSESKYGIEIHLNAGKVEYLEKTGCPKGTTITVSELFFNTPARYKFLKQDSTEAKYIIEAVTKIALAYPNISFKLENNSNEILFTHGDNDLYGTIYSIFGSSIAKKCIEVDYLGDKGIHIKGFIGTPDNIRANRAHQIFFVNGRWIKQSMLFSAVSEAYRTIIMKGKHPFVLLDINLSYEMVDVNVHPNKTEIRFSDESKVFSAVYHAIQETLSIIDTPKSFVESKDEILQDRDNKKDNFHYRDTIAPDKQSQLTMRQTTIEQGQGFKEQYPISVLDNSTFYQHTDSKNTVKSHTTQAFEEDIIIRGQVFSSYIIAEKGDAVYFVDQHAAHERLKYEKLKDDYKHKAAISQSLIEPLVVEMTPSDINEIQEHLDALSNLGFTIEFFGNNSIIVRAVPIECSDINIIPVLSSVLCSITQYHATEKYSYFDEALYQIACSQAIKANKTLSDYEAKTLVYDLLSLDGIYTCPHGRPAIVKMTKNDIEKLFKRRL